MEPFWLVERMRGWADRQALVWGNSSSSYGGLCAEAENWRNRLQQEKIQPGQVVALEAGYSPQACALLLALMENRNIAVPLNSATASQRERFREIAEVEASILFDAEDAWSIQRTHRKPRHPLLAQLREAASPGLILFSSGSTGESKAVVHHAGRLIEKFRVPRHGMRTLTFLLLDHIGGLNTLFYTLSNGGAVICVQERTPELICRAIQDHRVEMLPTSPTFLNLLLISEEYKRFDLSSLKLITYGTERMAEVTLQRLGEVFPSVRFQQTYGLSELGILRSKSKDSSSLWVRVGGEGFETKVVDGVLWVRAQSAMLGYLNAPSPFDAQGWFNTQDAVETDGEYIRILGRKSDLINVGGEKVYPAQVEEVLLKMDNVSDVTVRAEKNMILGNVVAATFTLLKPEEPEPFKQRVRAFCRERLPRYAVPARMEIAERSSIGPRLKKNRLVPTQP